jgi:hypothetical protein
MDQAQPATSRREGHRTDGSKSRIRIQDTWNTAILEELAPEPSDPIVSKRR